MKDSLRNDPRYRLVNHEDREILFNEYISELKSKEEEAARDAKAKKEEEVWTPSLCLMLTLEKMVQVNYFC